MASVLWKVWFPPTRIWTEEKSQQLSELGSETNRLKFALIQSRQSPSMHRGRNPAEVQSEYDKVRAKYDQLYQEFSGARDNPKTMAKILRWSGISCFFLGAIFMFVFRQDT